ncbi:hypothetical protein TYRP_003793, partial [Tyrophagus putrescentiae]
VALPWAHTSSLNLSFIPRQYLVPIKDFYYIIKKDYHRPYPPNYKRIDPAIDYVCKVTVGKGVKIVGRLIYDKQQCLIPEQFSEAQNAAQISSISAEEITSIKSGSQWPHFEVLLNPRGFTLAWAALDLRQGGGGGGENGAKMGLMPARPVLAEKVPASSSSYSPPFIAVYKPTSSEAKRMKLYLLYFTFYLIINKCFTTGDDWTHSGRGNSPSSSDYDDGDDGEESKVNSLKREAKQLQIGVALPWAHTSSLNLSSAIPRQYLVPIPNYYAHKNKHPRKIARRGRITYVSIAAATTDYVCKVTVGKGVKIVGRLIYDKQQCFIPEQFPAAQNAAQISSISAEKIHSIKSGSHWPHFEVLLNPRGFTLAWVALDLRQGGGGGGGGRAKKGFLPPRPVLAEKPKETSSGVYYTGVVQEVSENGTLAFYYGLYNVQRLPAYVVSVLAVLNTRCHRRPTKLSSLYWIECSFLYCG